MKHFFLLCLALCLTSAALHAQPAVPPARPPENLRNIGLPDTQQIVSLQCDAEGIPENPPAWWLPVVELPAPPYDAATQTVQPLLVWLLDRVERQWVIVELTVREKALKAIAAGYTVQPEGFVLSVDKADRNSFDQMITLVLLLQSSGKITASTPHTIEDKDGVTHTVTTARFLQIMEDYGVYYKMQWDLSKVQD